MSDPATTCSGGTAPRKDKPRVSLVALRTWLVPALGIVAATLLVYLPVLRGGFFWDDYGFVIGNPIVEAGDGLRRFWLTREAKDFFPLTSSTFWVEWRLWGNHAAGYHVVNVLLHAASAIVLWRILRRLRAPGAWLAGLIFAVHPVAAASVAWISERKNTLSLALYLLCILAYLTHEDRGKRRWYALALGLFLLTLLAKTSAVMLPVVLLLCAWWRRRRISLKDVARSAPFFALSLVLGLVTVWFQWHNAIHGDVFRAETAASRVAATGWIFWSYLYKLFIPADLCVLYARWVVPGSSVLAFLPLALLAAGMAWLWTRRKDWSRAPLFAASYFLISLLPVLGLAKMAFMGYAFVADHLQYIAMIGVIAFAAGLLAPVAGATARRRRLRGLAAAGCIVGLGMLTWNRASLYADEGLLWRDNVARSPTAWAAWINLGDVYSRAGRHGDAIRSFERAIALRPETASAYVYRGNAFALDNRLADAVSDYSKAIGLQSLYTEAWVNRGNVLVRMGRCEPALLDYDRAIELDPRSAPAYYNRGKARAAVGRLGEAIQDYDKALGLAPNFADAWYNRGNVCRRANRLDEAIHDYGKAIELKPDFAVAYNNRAVARFLRKEYDKALADVKRYEELGGRPDPAFFKALTDAAGAGKREP